MPRSFIYFNRSLAPEYPFQRTTNRTTNRFGRRVANCTLNALGGRGRDAADAAN